jgi:hypothetical protein
MKMPILIIISMIVCLHGNELARVRFRGLTRFDGAKWMALLDRFPEKLKQSVDTNNRERIAIEIERTDDPKLIALLLEVDDDFIVDHAVKALERCGTIAQLPVLLHRLEQMCIPPGGGTESQGRRNSLLMKMEACAIKLLKLELVPEQDERIPLKTLHHALKTQQQSDDAERESVRLTPKQVTAPEEKPEKIKATNQALWIAGSLIIICGMAWLVLRKRSVDKYVR